MFFGIAAIHTIFVSKTHIFPPTGWLQSQGANLAGKLGQRHTPTGSQRLARRQGGGGDDSEKETERMREKEREGMRDGRTDGCTYAHTAR